MVVVVLVGAPLAGKKSVADLLQSLHGFRRLDWPTYCAAAADHMSKAGVVNCKNTLEQTNDENHRQLLLGEKSTDDAQEKQIVSSSKYHALEMLKAELVSFRSRDCVITGLQHLTELQIRERPFVVSLAVEASFLTRSKRSQQDITNFAEKDQKICFGCEGKESCEIEGGCVSKCLRQSDFSVCNEGSIEMLKHQIAAFKWTDSELYRPSFDSHFIAIAQQLAMRSNCLRRTVGAVLVKDHRILATGYNGTPTGVLNCNQGGCARCADLNLRRGEDLHSCLCMHAETNALLQAGLRQSKDATLYVTCFPCLSCAKLVVQAEIKRLVYASEYDGDQRSVQLFEQQELETLHYVPRPQKHAIR